MNLRPSSWQTGFAIGIALKDPALYRGVDKALPRAARNMARANIVEAVKIDFRRGEDNYQTVEIIGVLRGSTLADLLLMRLDGNLQLRRT